MMETITAVKAKPQETWGSQQVFHVLMTKRTSKSVSLHSVPLFFFSTLHFPLHLWSVSASDVYRPTVQSATTDHNNVKSLL